LRLAGAATPTEGNALLPAFIADYNARFAKALANDKDLHRPLRWRRSRRRLCLEGRTHPVTGADLKYDKVRFILEPSEQARAAIGKRVTVIDYRDCRLSIRYRGVELAYRTFDKVRQVSQVAIVENKQLGAALALIEQQLRREPQRRSDRAPRRRDQHTRVCFKSAERFYVPGVLAPAR
jgi:hypothetical protein